MRIAHVARDAAFQRMLGGDEFAAAVVREPCGWRVRPGYRGALRGPCGGDPGVRSACLGVGGDPGLRATAEPHARGARPLTALSARSATSPTWSRRTCVGHSAGVAELAADAGQRCGLGAEEILALRRGALVHDVGRVAVPARIWQHPGPLSPDDWERVRLHAYQTERILSRSPFLASLAPIAAFHHERLDGSGYHRGCTAAALAMPARVLAAADAYHTMIEPRPHRDALSPAQAADRLGEEVRSGRLDPDAVGAVLSAAGQRVPRIRRPAGLTDRESQVVACSPGACRPSRSPVPWGSRSRPPTATSRTPTGRWVSPPGRVPRCSRCSTASRHGENSR